MHSSDGVAAYKDPALPMNVKDLFGGPPSASGQPEIIYPLTGSMHAMNQGDITFQWGNLFLGVFSLLWGLRVAVRLVRKGGL